jgi:hypothetical protein
MNITQQRLKDLLAMRELLSDPTRWAKGCYAYDRNGLSTHYMSGYAEKFCLLGAAMRSCEASRERLLEVSDVLGQFVYPDDEGCPDTVHSPISKFNDARATTHWDILNLLNDAVAFAEKDN